MVLCDPTRRNEVYLMAIIYLAVFLGLIVRKPVRWAVSCSSDDT